MNQGCNIYNDVITDVINEYLYHVIEVQYDLFDLL